jgi:hypothetical protein
VPWRRIPTRIDQLSAALGYAQPNNSSYRCYPPTSTAASCVSCTGQGRILRASAAAPCACRPRSVSSSRSRWGSWLALRLAEAGAGDFAAGSEDPKVCFKTLDRQCGCSCAPAHLAESGRLRYFMTGGRAHKYCDADPAEHDPRYTSRVMTQRQKKFHRLKKKNSFTARDGFVYM